MGIDAPRKPNRFMSFNLMAHSVPVKLFSDYKNNEKRNKYFNVLVLSISLNAQEIKPQKASLDTDIEITLDSISFYQPEMEMKIIDINKFTPDLIATPENAMQVYISFTIYEVGHTMTTKEYCDQFPGEITLEHRNSKEFRENLFLMISRLASLNLRELEKSAKNKVH